MPARYHSSTLPPLLRFLALGALLYAGERTWALLHPPQVEISNRIEAATNAAVEEEILYREALRRGLDRDDPVIQQRLIQVMLSLAPKEGASDAEYYEEAIALGLDRADVVVRRRLVERIRLAIESQARDAGVSEEELHARYERELQRFRQPATIRLSHVFVDRGRRGERTEAEALEMLEALRRGDEVRGDPLPFSTDVRASSAAELGQRFGEEFAQQVFALPLDTWSGPLPSAFGLHLVKVSERTDSAPLSFEAARNQLRREILDERAAAALRDAVAQWREQYEVVTKTSHQ